MINIILFRPILQPILLTTGYRDNLKYHIAQLHNEDKPITCSICLSEFARKDALAKHVAIVHEGKRKQYKCSTCNEIFNEKIKLTKHTVFVHEKGHGGKAHFCKLCDERFTFKSQLVKHRLFVHKRN